MPWHDKHRPNPIRELLSGARELVFIPPTIELTGNIRATIQGARGILEYEEGLIRVSMEEMEACIYGSGLSIGSLSSDSLEITGRIERVEYR